MSLHKALLIGMLSEGAKRAKWTCLAIILYVADMSQSSLNLKFYFMQAKPCNCLFWVVGAPGTKLRNYLWNYVSLERSALSSYPSVLLSQEQRCPFLVHVFICILWTCISWNNNKVNIALTLTHSDFHNQLVCLSVKHIQLWLFCQCQECHS